MRPIGSPDDAAGKLCDQVFGQPLDIRPSGRTAIADTARGGDLDLGGTVSGEIRQHVGTGGQGASRCSCSTKVVENERLPDTAKRGRG